ncbi:6236_t:CDS:1, partial [Rhizophagus irregularis]
EHSMVSIIQAIYNASPNFAKLLDICQEAAVFGPAKQNLGFL